MFVALWILLAASFIGSGILFRHERLLTYLATAAALTEVQWLLLTLLARTVLIAYDASLVYLIGTGALAIIWLTQMRHWSLGWRLSFQHLQKDVVIIIVGAVVLVSAASIAAMNGYQDGAWVMHGFFNGDVVTMASLVQKSLQTTGLAAANPFAASTSLEYPTLLHASLAGFFMNLGIADSWLRWLPWLTFAQIIITVPLFFLLWDRLTPVPKAAWQNWFGLKSRSLVIWLQALIILYVMALSWDSFVYPQSHFFLMGIFLLAVAGLVSFEHPEQKQSWLVLGIAWLTAFLLWRSNAVTGAAAVLLAGGLCFKRFIDGGENKSVRFGFGLALLGWGAVFFLFSPGQSALGMPHFSYSAAFDMLRLSPVVLLLAFAAFFQLSRWPHLNFSIAALLGLSFLTFAFSTRNIVTENASRFLYHAILMTFPILMYPLLRGYFIARRDLHFTTHTFTEKISGATLIVGALGFLAMPAAASLATTHDNLWRKDTQTVSASYLTALSWLKSETPDTAIIVANPAEPWAVPLFTGRTLMRADYWLAPDDAALNQVKKAFEGETLAQKQAVTLGDYLVLIGSEASLWTHTTSTLTRAYSNDDVAIFRLK